MSTPNGPRRTTKQRVAIANALRDSDRFRSAQELHEELRGSGQRVGLTTIYRELQTLAEAGDIDAIATPSGETIYRSCRSENHHHHLVCRSCGASVEIESRELEEWARRTAGSHGFTGVVHVAELYGLCGHCDRGAGGKASEAHAGE